MEINSGSVKPESTKKQVRQPSSIGKLPYLFLSYQKLFSNFISALIGKD